MNLAQNTDYPGDYNPNPRAPIQFRDELIPEDCQRVWMHPLGTEEEEDDDDDSSNDEDDDMDDDDDDENVLIVKADGRNGFLLSKFLKEAVHCRVRYAHVVRRREITADVAVGPDTLAGWDRTGERCVVWEMRHDTIRRDIDHYENPLAEIIAMQYIKQWSEAQQGGGDPQPPTMGMEQLRVVLPRDFLTVGEYLYIIMPYLNGGDLLDQLVDRMLHENQARFWFRQMLSGLKTLQEARVCHRSICPENILVHNGSCLVTGMGSCLRIPYLSYEWCPELREIMIGTRDGGSSLSILNGFEDTIVRNIYSYIANSRCLITPQPLIGGLICMSPEIYHEKAFDGHAVDLWSVAVILFIMLTGSPPWDRPTDEDRRYTTIVDGGLNELLIQWELLPGLSPDAVDLLQRMLFRNPRDRLSLDQILAHPWLANE